jgi:hypothetical protein
MVNPVRNIQIHDIYNSINCLAVLSVQGVFSVFIGMNPVRVLENFGYKYRGNIFAKLKLLSMNSDVKGL